MLAIGDIGRAARFLRHVGGLELGRHAAGAERALAGRRLHIFADVADFLHQLCLGVVGIAIIEPFHAREDHEVLGPDHLRHFGGQAVVVADADFLGRDRIVLVHDRDHPGFEQAVDGIAGVEEPPVILEIAQRQQDLRDLETVFMADLLVSVEQQRHPAGGGGLLVADPGGFRRFADRLQAQRDRAGGTEDDVVSLAAQLRHVLQQPLDETEAGGEQVGIGEESGTNLDDDASILGHDKNPFLAICASLSR